MGSTLSTHAARVEHHVRHADAPHADATGRRLLESWRRSLETYQLDPGRAAQPRILTRTELKDRLEAMECFLRIARHGVRRLHEQVREASYVVLLTDMQGVTIDFVADNASDRDLKRAGLYLGSCWSERDEGTCGVGTAIVDRCPIIVHKSEHFRAPNISLTCSSVPIFDPDGSVLAILDASALYSPDDRKSQILALQFVTQSATMIENAYFLDRYSNQWVLQVSGAIEFAQVETDCLIAFDEHGNVLAANQKARADLLADAPPRCRIEDLFDERTTDLMRHAQTPNVVLPLRAARAATAYCGRVRPPRDTASGARSSARPSSAALPTASVRPLPIDHIAGAEPRMRDNAARVRRLLDVPIPLLLLGETGTGKEAFAKAIHESSARHARPFVAVNCAAIPESLIESELFGYTDGAFTGARAKGMRGRLQQASGGTLFLDEIGDMPLALQTRLLRVLAEGEIQPLGGGDTQRVDLHVICATHRDLAALVRAGRFRQDLYYRLAGASFVLPPLRTRSDVPVLMEAILAEECAAAGRSAVLDGSALDALLTHTWPGNIRELRNALRYAVAMTPDGVIASECLPAYLAGPMLPPDIPAVERGIAPDDDDYDERQRVITALRSTHWCAASAARVLGISRATLYRRMHQHRIVSPNRADLSGSE